MEDEITAMEEIETRQHVLFSELNSGFTSNTAWECVLAAVNEVRQKNKTLADIKKK